MKKRAAFLGDHRLVVVLFVILVVFLSASLALASNTAPSAQLVPLSTDGIASYEMNASSELVMNNAAPITCTEGILNGGFEARTNWTTLATNYTAGYTTAVAHSGTSSMRTGIVNGGTNVVSYSSAYQTVKLPADAQQITLGFWILPKTTETPATAPLRLPSNPLGIREEDAATASDWQFVFILNSYGTVVEQLVYQRKNATAWQYFSFDLSHRAGQTIKVYFDTYNNGWGGITGMYVDDVSLQICDGTPPPPNQDGTIAGTVMLQGRSDYSGAQVCAENGGAPVCVNSNAAGAYSIGVPQGTYSVTVDMPLYLDALKSNVAVTSSNTTNLTSVTLLGGDTNDDCDVNIQDLSLVGSHFGLTCSDIGWDARADINADCVVDVLDLTAVGSNFNKTCPVPWN